MKRAKPCKNWKPTVKPRWAHHWCDACGWRADLHPGSGPAGHVVERIIGRAS